MNKTRSFFFFFFGKDKGSGGGWGARDDLRRPRAGPE